MSADGIPAGIEVEKVYLIEAQYTAEAGERRPAVRPEHLGRIGDLQRAGTVVTAGAYSDALTSSIIIVRADSEQAALALAHEDVYTHAGVWGEITARPFGLVSVTD